MTTPLAPVTLQVTVNGQLVTDLIQDAELIQTFFGHEIFRFRIEYLRATNLNNITLWPNNAPVQVAWGQGLSNVATWYGYVNHNAPATNSDSGNYTPQVTYYCLGTSKPMNSDVTKTWGQTSPTYMAKTIAAAHGLRAVLTTANWVSDYEVQAGESDFAFLVRMGEKYGFSFFVSGGTLYFINPSSVLAASSTQGIPQFVSNKSFASWDSIRNFTAISGDNIPGSEIATRVISGISSTTGQPFSVQAASSGNVPAATQTKIHTGLIATSVAEAQALANAWQASSQFYQQATAEVFGNVFVYPGKLVSLIGTALANGNTGYWMVGSATHTLRVSGTGYTVNDKFATTVSLLRNQNGVQPNVTNTSIISPEFVTCQLNSGVWKAAQLSVLYDGILT